MIKPVLALLLLLLLPSAHAETQIIGIKGGALKNVRTRLDELQQVKSLNQYSDKELVAQIGQSLQPFGFFHSSIRISREAKLVLIQVDAGVPVRIHQVQIELTGEGSQHPQLKQLLLQPALQSGQPLSIKAYNQLKQDLAVTAEQLGYLRSSFSKAQLEIDTVNNRADISLIFDTGPLYYFGQIEFDPTYIKPELLHRFVPFQPGQVYSSAQILDLNNYLSGSGYFSSVSVKPIIGDSPTVPVRIHTEPVPKYSYSLGVGFGTDTGVRGRAGLQVVPVNRLGHKFNALAQGSQTQSAVQAQYLIPGHDPVADQYSISGNYSSLNYDSGYSNSFLASLAHLHHKQNFQRTLSLNGLYESYRYTLQTAQDQFLLYPKATLTFSKTENVLFSPSGYNLTLNGLGAGQFAMSQINVVQVSADAKAAWFIEPLRLRLYGHGIVGTTAIADINHLPLSLAMLLGGADNLKGQSFNSIGPGKYTTYGGFELQKETFKNIYLTGFYDAGTVYNPMPKQMLYDVGGGIMWVSPIGPIKAGLAQNVNQNLQSLGGSPRLVISMGPDL